MEEISLTDFDQLNWVEHVGDYGSGCGYCHGPQKSINMGMWAHNLTVEAYQELLDRGWRRSGRWLYRPQPEKLGCECCPYTIRLDAHKFRPSKAQRRVLRIFEAYLAGAPLSAASDGAHPAMDLEPPQTPPLHAEHHAAIGPIVAAAAAGLQAFKKRRHSREQAQQSSSAYPTGEPSPDKGARPVSAKGGSPANAARPHAGSAKAQPAQQGAATEAVGAALTSAVAGMVSEGLLPDVAYPAPHVRVPSAQQRNSLGSSVVLTSPCALPMAAAARRASGDGAAMSADELAAALAARVGPLLAQSVPGSRLRVLPKGGHLNILQEEEEAGQHPVASKPEGPATQAHSCATAEAQGAKEREPGGLGQPCCRASPARSERQENLPGSRAGADGGRPSTGNRGPEAGPGPQTQRSAARGAHQQQQRQQRQPRRFEVRMVPMPAGPEVVAEEFALFRKYQILNHGDAPDDVKQSGFVRFLMDTPLENVADQEASGADESTPASCAYGSYHQQYWIDGRLVAVAVLDVLPRCLSSVYFFWDPDLAPLALGKLSALREVAWVAAAARARPALHWYYMGYYIHACPKMRYKAEFAPSDLLCMRDMVWVPFEHAIVGLRRDPACTLSQIEGGEDSSAAGASGAAGGADAGGAEAAAALEGTLLFASFRRGSGGRLLRLQQLAGMEVPQVALQSLKEKLLTWRALVGPVADTFVHLM